MSSTKEYTLVLSKDEFYDTVVKNIENLPLKELFFIDEWYINRLIRNWSISKFEDDYRVYIFGLLMVKDNTERLDTELCLWKITRRIVEELIIALAEGFYYDDFVSVIGENIPFSPYANASTDIDKDKLLYFFEIIDSIYDRYYVNTDNTLTQVRKIMGKDYLK